MNDDNTDLAIAEALGIATEAELVEAARLRRDGASELRQDYEQTVRRTRETLAALSLTTVIEAPPNIRARVLSEIHSSASVSTAPVAPVHDLAARRRARRWTTVVGSAAAAVLLVVGGMLIGREMVDTTGSTMDRVMAAADATSTRAALPGGGSATAVYSKTSDAAVVLLDGSGPPPANHVYQMWLVGGADKPVSAGVVGADRISPATTAMVVNDIGKSSTLAFTVEPSGGSDQPTTKPFAAITLT